VKLKQYLPCDLCADTITGKPHGIVGTVDAQSSSNKIDPLFTLRDLVYSSDVSGSANVGAVANESMQQEFSKPTTPVSSTITWSSGTSAQVPSLSPAAKAYYRNIGVSVT